MEYLGLFSEGRANDRSSQYLSPGIHYLINKNFEVDVRVGWGPNNDSANFFSNVVAGLRF